MVITFLKIFNSLPNSVIIKVFRNSKKARSHEAIAT